MNLQSAIFSPEKGAAARGRRPLIHIVSTFGFLCHLPTQKSLKIRVTTDSVTVSPVISPSENDVFILDEPFNGVDLKGCILMKRLIRQLKAKEKTVIISSHLIASLREICDIIHYLNEGVIYKEYHEETTEEIEEDILCNTKKIQSTSYFQ